MKTQVSLLYEERKNHVKSNKETEKYLQSMEDTPINACCICDRLYFGKDMRLIDKVALSTFRYLMPATKVK